MAASTAAQLTDYKRVVDAFHRFLATMEITHGQVEGTVRLPVPPNLADISKQLAGQIPSSHPATTNPDTANLEISVRKDHLHLAESVVVAWTRLVRAHLKSAPPEATTPKTSDPFPGPLVEIDSIKQRASDLHALLLQLGSNPDIRRLFAALELIGSPMAAAFAALETELRGAAAQANAHVMYASCALRTPGCCASLAGPPPLSCTGSRPPPPSPFP
jgi:hypothetical protein